MNEGNLWKGDVLNSMSKQELLMRNAHWSPRTDDSCSNTPAKVDNIEKKGHLMDWGRFETKQIALRVAYIGAGYSGMAIQGESSSNTIEGVILGACKRVRLIPEHYTLDSINFSRCGRTDRGVSAFGNVISLRLRSRSKAGSDADRVDHAVVLNRALPKDIRIVGSAEVPDDFNARRACLRRTYKYFFFSDGMDINQMRQGAKKLCGSHDFSNFCKMDVLQCQTFVRNIESISIERVYDVASLGDARQDDMFSFVIKGNAFLYHQVRCMVAILFLIGRGLERPSVVDYLLDVSVCKGRPDYAMASEAPLVLYDCEFEGLDFSLSKDAISKMYPSLQSSWRRSQIDFVIARQLTMQLEPSCIDNGDARHVFLMDRPHSMSFSERVERLAPKKRTKLNEILQRQLKSTTDW